MIQIIKFLLSLLCGISTVTLASHTIQPYFAAPYSGKPVHEYELKLPLSRSEQKTFTIPNECAALTSALIAGAGQWGNRIERRMWLKADDDCHYYNFLKHSRTHAKVDHVSQYNFMQAHISDLPLRPGCDPMQFLTNPSACPPSMPSMPDFTQFLSAPLGFNHTETPDNDQCTFQNGIFRGHIMNSGNGIHCIKNKRAPGFRILSVDYADVNGDGFQDAILRMIPIGSGVSPVPMMLPLTRFEKQGKFSIPQGIAFPSLGPPGKN